MFANQQRQFAPTRWTLVVRAQGETSEARVALAELCECYYKPVLHFLRCRQSSQDSAEELAQAFFARILARGNIGDADPQRGRFRSYLLGALKHFLADRQDQASTLRRGGGILHAPISDAMQVPDRSAPPDNTYFDRSWALAIVERSLHSVALEFRDEGREKQFAVLKAWLIGDVDPSRQADAARELGISEGAVKVAIHRLRKRFREATRREIAQTVDDATEVEPELKYLVEVLATSG
jgi:DNA-directed RNA polymerase specialized sigma24 family protein